MKKILIIGSNFGSKNYLQSLLKYKENLEIYICSPNIQKKKINKNIIKYVSYIKAFNENKFDFIICATKPDIQYKVIKFLKLNHRNIKGIILEKPISSNFKKTQEAVNILKKIKIPFLVNFTFTELNVYKKFKDILYKNMVNNLNYNWKYKQAYFKNNIPTWKINEKAGGGLLKYYGIHVFYHLVDLLKLTKNTKFKIEKVTLKKKKIVYVKINFSHNGIKLNLSIDINSNTNLHSIISFIKKDRIELINKQKDWTTGFKLLKNKKFSNFNKESRIKLSKKTLDKLIFNYKNLNNKTYSEYVNKVIIAHALCEKIYKKIVLKYN